jgi:hypothetical protein
VSETFRFIHCTRRSFDCGGTAIDRELRFSVENDEHLLDGVVKVVADAGSRRDHAAMEKVELGRDGPAIEECGEGHAAGPSVHGGRLPERSRVGVDDSLRQSLRRRLLREQHRSRGHAEE